MSSRRTSPATEPLEDDDLLGEILLRLPPKPSSLPRASLVCKRWRSIATDAAFRRRFRAHHRKPPILGAFLECATELKFIPLLDPPDRIPSERFSLDLTTDERSIWSVLGCRHGRVLLINRWAHALLVFEPVSRGTLHILIPPEFVVDEFTTANGAVLCAAGDDNDHVHGDCHRSPFKVVLVGIINHEGIARVYSSETRMWGDLVSTPYTGHNTCFPCTPCTLIGASLYWCLYRNENRIVQFSLDDQSLTLVNKPSVGPVGSESWIIRAEDGGLGFAMFLYPSLQLWDRKVDYHGVATWVTRKNINMDEILGPKANSAQILGYAEDVDAIFMSVYKDSYTHVLTIVQLESMMVKECPGDFSSSINHPLSSFYTAGTARA